MQKFVLETPAVPRLKTLRTPISGAPVDLLILALIYYEVPELIVQIAMLRKAQGKKRKDRDFKAKTNQADCPMSSRFCIFANVQCFPQNPMLSIQVSSIPNYLCSHVLNKCHIIKAVA